VYHRLIELFEVIDELFSIMMEQSLVITEEKEKNIFEHKSLCFVEFDSDAESPDESDNENENSTKTQVKHDRNRIELCFFF